MSQDIREPSVGPSGRSTLVSRWLDAANPDWSKSTADDNRVEWLRVTPFILLHALCLTVFLVGFSWTAFAVAGALYFFRVFALTGFYHRYFAHRAFRTSRAFQLIMGVCGSTAIQRGPLWWAAHHRHHHAFSDRPEDLHSPRQRGFWMSHVGWFMTRTGFRRQDRYIPDLLRYPELILLDRFDWFVPALLGVGLFALGAALERFAPSLGTSGWQMLVWGFLVSTVAVYQATFAVNSLTHMFGRRRYETGDDSRNSAALALITFGEGWHNNHHHYPAAARQGFFWWEIDVTYYLLRLLSWLGVVWELQAVPAHAVSRDLVLR